MSKPSANAALDVDQTDSLYEVVNGQRMELQPMGTFECWLASRLLVELQPFCQANKLGRAVMETLFLLDMAANLQRRPDVALVSYDRWPKNRKVPRTSAWAVVPDLAVEVVSPTNAADEVMGKVREYFEAGCRRVWVIYPTEEQIYVYSSATETRILAKADILDDAALLPGFHLPVGQLFEEE